MKVNRMGQIDFGKKLATFLISFSVVALCPGFSRTSFEVYDINSSNSLLYSVERNLPGSAEVSTLFECTLGKNSADGKPTMLTCVPEKMEMLSDSVVQIRNSFGSARYNLSTGNLMWSLVDRKLPGLWYECERQCESPDGKWICQESPDGALVLIQSSNGVQVQISKGHTVSDKALVKWSDDSKFFLYEENGTVYFASTEVAIKNLLPPESMRKIGEGTLDSVQWIGGSLFYANGDILYRMEERELYTRGLYYPVLGSGTPVARLTSDFDSFHDNFWISSDEKYLLYISAKKMATLYAIPSSFGFLAVREMESLIGLSGSILDVKVLWSSNNVPLLWMENLSYSKGKKSASVYSMNNGLTLLGSYDDPRDLSLNNGHAAFSYGDRLEIHKIDDWKMVDQISGEKILSFKWNGDSSIIVGGNKTVFQWKENRTTKKWTKTVLYLSSIKTAVWESNKILAWTDIDNTCYEFDGSKNSWKAIGKRNPPVSRGSAMNGKYRAYTAECPNSLYDNAIFVRSLTTPSFTYPLIEETGEEKKSKGKVTLVFEATEGNEGLAQVLEALEVFGIRSTFFVNGEFIRRYPMEVCQIVASGNHCASGFFTTADLMSKDFTVNADFIRRGLARNEDEFYVATGKELELQWHAPFYRSNEMMVYAGEMAGYTYVDAWNGCSDRISFEQALSTGEDYLNADEIISRISESLYDSMIISVDIGNIKGSRSDYLYEKIQTLIRSILDKGYAIGTL